MSASNSRGSRWRTAAISTTSAQGASTAHIRQTVCGSTPPLGDPADELIGKPGSGTASQHASPPAAQRAAA
jgi:hypothetical protein